MLVFDIFQKLYKNYLNVCSRCYNCPKVSKYLRKPCVYAENTLATLNSLSGVIKSACQMSTSDQYFRAGHISATIHYHLISLVALVYVFCRIYSTRNRDITTYIRRSIKYNRRILKMFKVDLVRAVRKYLNNVLRATS